MADYYADMIRANSVQMTQNADWLRGAMVIIFIALLVGAGVGALVR